MIRRAASLAERMRGAAERLLEALDPDQRRLAVAPFDVPDHRQWTYLPGSRPGLAVAAMTDEQVTLVLALLDTGLSVEGAATARDVMALDDVLRDIEQARGRPGWQQRGADQYWVRILGVPTRSERSGAGSDTGAWAWRVNGHHLAVHVTVVGDRVAGAPQFFGANPAVVRSGPLAGWQVLRPEECLARHLLGLLDDEQRRRAIVSDQAPGDIRTRHDPVAQAQVVPQGVLYGSLDADQAEALERLVRQYVDRLVPEIADATWSEIVRPGLGSISFAWAGSTQVGGPHYYALTGPTFIAEYDNVQDGANHVHTVWRDLRNDWGQDLLAEHYRSARH